MLLCLSANHKNTSFTVLEQIAGIGLDLASEILEIDAIIGAIVVSTCNRFEVYTETADQLSDVHELIALLQERISQRCKVAQLVIVEQTVCFIDQEVSEHLFALAAGLESVVIGETEIAGQVKRALKYAQNQKTTSAELERLFQRAAQTSRGIKTRTDVSSMGRSLLTLSLDLVSNRVGDWSSVEMLLIGTGRYATNVISAVTERGVKAIKVYSPSGRGTEYAGKHNLELVKKESLINALASAELVIACSATNKPVVTKAMMEQAKEVAAVLPHKPRPAVCPVTGQVTRTNDRTHAGKSRERHILIDLGLPRNLDPGIISLPATDLIDLDTLRIHAPFEELGTEQTARNLVNIASNKFVSAGKEREVTPAIIAFRKHLEKLAAVSQSKAGEESEAAKRVLNHFIGSLMHTPLVRSRELAQQGEVSKFLEALSVLFDLEIDDS